MEEQQSNKATYGQYLLLFVLGILVVAMISMYAVRNMNQDSGSQISEESEDFQDSIKSEDFKDSIEDFGQESQNMNAEERLQAANRLLTLSDNDIERGRANLSVGLAERMVEPVAAIERFKMVSQTESFHPFTRAIAMWYTVEPYFGSRDTDFARDYIYTGDLWGSFVDTSYADNPELMYRLAAINALEESLSIQPTLQANTRLAAESAALLAYDNFTAEFKARKADQVEALLVFAEQELPAVENQSSLEYAGTEYLTIATARNNIALALDTLYINDYVTDVARVQTAYEEALDAVVSYNLQTDHAYFVRYNYADFLARNNLEENQDTIVRVLGPMAGMRQDSLAATYFVNKLMDEDQPQRSDSYTGHPDTMRKLAAVSSEFRTALLQIGVTEDQLTPSAATRSNTEIISDN